MKKTTISETLKYCIISACVYVILVGAILILDVYEKQQMGYLHYSNFLDEMVSMYYIIICYIVIPFGVIVSMLTREKIIYAFSMICEELMIIYDYICLRKSKTYSKFKVFYLTVCVVAIVVCALWLFKKISNIWMLGIMLLTQLEGLEWIIKNGENTKSLVLVMLLFIALLVMKTLSIYVITVNGEHNEKY